MEKNTVSRLSAKAEAIVDSFIRLNHLEPKRAYALVLELYSRRSDSDKEICSTLSALTDKYVFPFSEQEFALLDAEYDEVVKYCHKFIVNLEKAIVKSGIFHIPDGLIDLCSKLINCTEEESVFLPFAGYGDLAFSVQAKSISGFEKDDYTVAFSSIFFEAYGIDGRIVTNDSLVPEVANGQSYNHIVSLPPVLTRTENQQIADYMLDLLQNGLAPKGDMFLILPLEDMTTGTWYAFRNYLVKNKHSYQVLSMSLPSIFQPRTAAKFCLLFIEKSDNPGGQFYFMESDRKEFYFSSKDEYRRLILKVDSIIDTIMSGDDRYFHASDLEKDFRAGNSPSFAPSRYFVDDNLPELKEGFEYLFLRELVGEVVHYDLQVVNEVNDYYLGPRPAKYIRISSLYDNYMSCIIDYDKISETLPPQNVYEGYASGGYAAFINGKIKVGQVLNNSKTVPFDANIAHFAIKSDERIRMEYLLRELTSDYVLEQARHFSFGSAIQKMRSSDFYKLKIAVPSLDVQDEILKQDRIAAIEKAGVKVDELNEKFRKDIHMMKHALGQTVFNLSNWMQVLNQARKNGNGILDENAQIGGLVKVSTGEVFDNIEIAIKVLSRQVSSFDVGYGMKVSQFSLADFIDKYIETHPRPNVKYDFSSAHYRTDILRPNVYADGPNIIENSGEPALVEGVALDYVVFPEEALLIIVDNIVSNAVSHGFKDPEKEYTIHFEFKPEGTSYILSISNDGDPLPTDKDPEDVFVLGHTSGGRDHAGIGGYQVRSLMEDFGGKADIVSTPDEEFKVTYKLTFTKTNLVDLSL